MRIDCPHRGAPIDREGCGDLLAEHVGVLPTLGITNPCCATATSLDRLDYDWPYGFAPTASFGLVARGAEIRKNIRDGIEPRPRVIRMVK
jgi:hypothetical protein